MLTEGANKVETASYVEGLKGRYQFLPERPRFVTLSDSQVLDRLYRPLPNMRSVSMAACNDTCFSDLSLNKEERLARLLSAKHKMCISLI